MKEDSGVTFSRGSNRKCYILLGLVTIAVGLGIGILIGTYAISRYTTDAKDDGVFLPGVSKKIITDGPDSVGQEFIQNLNPDNIRKHLRKLSSHPHLAGTPADKTQALELSDFWMNIGLDDVEMTPYDVLLSYPNTSDPNLVTLLDESGNVIFTSRISEKNLTENGDDPDIVPPFNAFSAKGDVQGDLIYVNYGRVEDFNWLVQNKSLNFSGKIVIARYGAIFRGDKVEIAERFEVSGIILYSDPIDYTLGDNPKLYPDDWWLPGSGVQRGSIQVGSGDPATPGYPALPTAFRVKNPLLPGIPCHPIGYDDAQLLLNQMRGDEVPEEWRGKLNVTYRIGGLQNNQRSVKLHVATEMKTMTTYNVVGMIRGEIEPDRYVIIGNHRDAWVFGAMDPSGGTAIMMEISRTMTDLVKKGWRPRRTIVFSSWGAEEFGLIGSTEWVEQYIKSLGERAVAYLNVDIAVDGTTTYACVSSPLLYHVLIEAMKRVPTPNKDDVAAGRKTIFENYFQKFPLIINNQNTGYPIMFNIGSGSDFEAFMHRIGVPCSSCSYTYDRLRIKLGSYPLYHSAYETFYAVENFVDPEFIYHAAVGQVWGETARLLADSLIIPFNVTDYAFALNLYRLILLQQHGQLMTTQGKIDLTQLSSAIQLFKSEAEQFNTRLAGIDKNNPLTTRRVNDQLMLLERAFTDPAGLPGRPLFRHLIFAPSSVDKYTGVSFPGLVDAMFEIEQADNPEERWVTVRQHYAVLVFTIESAASTLRDVTNFMTKYLN